LGQDEGRTEGEFITVGMSVTNRIGDYRMRCTLIIRAMKRATRKEKQSDRVHGWRIIAPCDVTVMDYNTSEPNLENELYKNSSNSS
jgi:hypothetical protein